MKFCHIHFHFLLTKKKVLAVPVQVLHSVSSKGERGGGCSRNCNTEMFFIAIPVLGVLYTYGDMKSIAVHKLYSSRFSVPLITYINRGAPRKMSP